MGQIGFYLLDHGEVIKIVELPWDNNALSVDRCQHVFHILVAQCPQRAGIDEARFLTGNIEQHQLSAIGELNHERLVSFDELH